MNIPENLKYSSDHEWIRVEGEVAYVGITDFAQHELGDIVFVDITTEGETLEKGEVFGRPFCVARKARFGLWQGIDEIFGCFGRRT